MISEKLQEDLKQAQLARDEVKVSTLRLLLSEIKNTQIQKGAELSDEDIVSVIQKEAKKRRESIESFKAGNREDLAQKEQSELEILQAYLPAQLTSEELTKLVDEAITKLEAEGLIAQAGAISLTEMGKVMSLVMGKVSGRADGGSISQLVKERLSK